VYMCWCCFQSSAATLATDIVTAASSTTATTTITSRSQSEPALLPTAVPSPPSSDHTGPQSPAHGAPRRHGALERQNRLTPCDDNDDVV